MQSKRNKSTGHRQEILWSCKFIIHCFLRNIIERDVWKFTIFFSLLDDIYNPIVVLQRYLIFVLFVYAQWTADQKFRQKQL